MVVVDAVGANPASKPLGNRTIQRNFRRRSQRGYLGRSIAKTIASHRNQRHAQPLNRRQQPKDSSVSPL